MGARSLRDEGEARAIRPFPMPAPVPYHVPMHTQPSGANQLPTDPPNGRRRMAMGARKRPRNLPPSQRKHRFLREFKRVGTLSASRRAAGISYGEMLAWFGDDNFRRRLREATLVFSERLEELHLHPLVESDDGSVLPFKLRAELGEEYGGPAKPATPAAFLSMWHRELEREMGRARSAY